MFVLNLIDTVAAKLYYSGQVWIRWQLLGNKTDGHGKKSDFLLTLFGIDLDYPEAIRTTEVVLTKSAVIVLMRPGLDFQRLEIEPRIAL